MREVSKEEIKEFFKKDFPPNLIGLIVVIIIEIAAILVFIRNPKDNINIIFIFFITIGVLKIGLMFFDEVIEDLLILAGKIEFYMI